jgi:hypothetical protein
MTVHTKTNPNTVSKSDLPGFVTADTVMIQVSHILWEANKHDPTLWHDFWTNSTPAKGIRSCRVRFVQSKATNAVWQQVLDLLAPYEGCYKIYPWQYTTSCKFTCIMMYYRSWQAGQPRSIRECEPGHELLHSLGTRVLFKYLDRRLIGAISYRDDSSIRYPKYVVTCDEPPNKGYTNLRAYNVTQQDIVQVL